MNKTFKLEFRNPGEIMRYLEEEAKPFKYYVDYDYIATQSLSERIKMAWNIITAGKFVKVDE